MIAAVAINFGLLVIGLSCWALSTLTAGGGSVLSILLVAGLLRGHAIAPVVTIASPARIILFWGYIDRRVVRWHLPGATVGAILGGWAFSRASGNLIQVCIGLFLISTIWQFCSKDRPRDSRMRLAWFLPIAFASGLTSALVGASGLLANPFYLNYGLTKEPMLVTRAINLLTIQCIKLAMYAGFGMMNRDLLGHGVAIGAGAGLAVWLTRSWLHAIDPLRFRRWAVSVMGIAGLVIVWQQRVWLLSVWRD